AIATVLSKPWMSGSRHELALCTAAKLARLGWTHAEVSDLIKAIATEAKDEELDDRLLAADTTFERYKRGKPISGEERFVELLGETTAKNIHDWGTSEQSSAPIAKSDPTAPAIADLCSDTGAADAFATRFKGDLIYCDDKGWFLREKHIFEPLSPANV